MRGRFGRLIAVGLALLPLGWSLPRAAAQTPVKVGVLAPLTGPIAAIAKSEVNGIRLRLKENNYEVAGRKVELIVEDTAADPATGLTKVRKLVERDQVDVLLGPLTGHVVAAVQDYVGQKGVPQLPLVAQPPENARYRTTLVPSWNNVHISRVIGQYAYRKLGYRRAIIMASSFVSGKRISDGHREGFTAAGGTIVREIYPPLGTPDFAPFLAGLPPADAVFAFFPGADGIRYVKQRQELGIQMPLVSVITTVEPLILPAQGEAALGSLAITHYLESLDNQVNRHFLAAYAREYGEPARSYYPALGYTIVQILEEALRRTGGKTAPEALVAAMRQVDFESPQGRFRFDPEKPFGIMDFYIVKVVKKDGKMGYEVVDVLKEVKPE